MRAAQVLDMHADLASRLDDYRFRNVAAKSFGLDLGMEYVTGQERNEVAAAGEGLVMALRNHVRAAYAYQVTEDMSSLVQHAASALDADDTFDVRLAPSTCGLVRFERPLTLTDVRGRTLKLHWLAWGPVMVNGRPGTSLVWWNDADDPDEAPGDDTYDTVWRAVLGRWNWVGADIKEPGSRLGDVEFTPNDEQRAQIEAEGDVATPGSNPVRYVHALWLLLGQRLTQISDGDVDRAATKRAKRKGLPARVSVIELRAADARRQDGETLVEWSHRWPVRPHWRWQPHGTRAGLDHEHVYGDPIGSPGGVIKRCEVDGCENYVERTFINMFIKGPEGAPLILTDKVYRLSR